MELDSRKKSERNRRMRSKSFATQEMREIGRKQAKVSKGFPILRMQITEGVFPMAEKKSKDQEKLQL